MLPLKEYLVQKNWMEDATRSIGEIFDQFPDHSFNSIEYLFTSGVASFMCDPHGDRPSLISTDEVIHRINIAYEDINTFNQDKYKRVTPELIVLIHAKCWELAKKYSLLNYHDTTAFIEKEIRWLRENNLSS